MFEQLFKQLCALLRHQNAPLAAERASFLAKRAKDVAAPSTLVKLARELFVVYDELDFEMKAKALSVCEVTGETTSTMH